MDMEPSEEPADITATPEADSSADSASAADDSLLAALAGSEIDKILQQQDVNVDDLPPLDDATLVSPASDPPGHGEAQPKPAPPADPPHNEAEPIEQAEPISQEELDALLEKASRQADGDPDPADEESAPEVKAVAETAPAPEPPANAPPARPPWMTPKPQPSAPKAPETPPPPQPSADPADPPTVSLKELDDLLAKKMDGMPKGEPGAAVDSPPPVAVPTEEIVAALRAPASPGDDEADADAGRDGEKPDSPQGGETPVIREVQMLVDPLSPGVRLVAGVLEAINRPFNWVPPGPRKALGILALLLLAPALTILVLSLLHAQ